METRTVYYDIDGKKLENVAGDFHFWPFPHGVLSRIGPIGVPAWAWTCGVYGLVCTSLEGFELVNCCESEPCRSCGLRGVCASDCKGIAEILESSKVHVAGLGDHYALGPGKEN